MSTDYGSLRAFDYGWNVVKSGRGQSTIAPALRAIGDASLPMPPVFSGMAGVKNSKKYAELLRRHGGMGGHLRDPTMGYLGSTGILRPDSFEGGDIQPIKSTIFNAIMRNPDRYSWNPADEYTMRVDDPLLIPIGVPSSKSKVVNVGSVTEQMARDFHEATGGHGLDKDQIWNVPLKYRLLQMEYNDRIERGIYDDRTVQLALILQPQMQGGIWRQPGGGKLTIAPRSFGKKIANTPTGKILERIMVEQVIPRWPKGQKPSTTNMIRPQIPERFKADVDDEWVYWPWSQEWKDKDYKFRQADLIDSLDRWIENPVRGAKYLSDPPYLNEEGEHGVIDQGALLDRLGILGDMGNRVLAFNSAVPAYLREIEARKLFDEVLPLTRFDSLAQSKKGNVGETLGIRRGR